MKIDKQKAIKIALYIFGFCFQYIMPIILFGNVLPYTHEGVKAGLTKAGYFAFAIIVILIVKKVKEKILGLPKSLKRGLVLSIFPCVYWLVANIGVNYLLAFFTSFADWWGSVIAFIIIGRAFFVAYESFCEEESEKIDNE